MPTHQTKLAASPEVLPELDAGAAVTLTVEVSCDHGCDLRALPIDVVTDEGVLTISGREAVVLTAPADVGEHAWAIAFPRHEREGGVTHEESRLALCFTTRPHASSVAVWDVPSPVVVNQTFTVKIGVACSSACQLSGRRVEVCDDGGVLVGVSRLGDTPWPGTNALYVAEVEVTAPATEGIRSWSARFTSDTGLLPHEAATGDFSFRSDRPPEHHVDVNVADRETQAPIEGVEVRLGAYLARTDARGLARLGLPGGVYPLDAWKGGYETLRQTVEVDRDLVIQIEAARTPEEDPDSERVWM